jgi:hypothetical protein
MWVHLCWACIWFRLRWLFIIMVCWLIMMLCIEHLRISEKRNIMIFSVSRFKTMQTSYTGEKMIFLGQLCTSSWSLFRISAAFWWYVLSASTCKHRLRVLKNHLTLYPRNLMQMSDRHSSVKVTEACTGLQTQQRMEYLNYLSRNLNSRKP